MPSCAKANLSSITLGSSENPFLCDFRRQYLMPFTAIRIAPSLASNSGRKKGIWRYAMRRCEGDSKSQSCSLDFCGVCNLAIPWAFWGVRRWFLAHLICRLVTPSFSRISL
jgi:hypothetical protein